MTEPSVQARLTMRDAFERFAKTVTPDDIRILTNIQLTDVREEAIKIQRQLAQRRTMRAMGRLEPFLRGLEHYSKVVEVLCNGTPYLSWIWSPIKLMLMISVDCLDAFNRLIDAYSKIAEELPRFDRLGTALSHDHNFQAVLALVYADILEFHRYAYKFVRRKSWAIFFGSMWAGFESRFGTILKDLSYHKELVDKEAIAVNISEAVTQRKEQARRWKMEEDEWKARKVRGVLSWLRTDDALQEDVLERVSRDCLPSSCNWFINHPRVQPWWDDGAENSLVWLYGKPGAGKSVICSNLVQHAESQNLNIFFYFCSYLGTSTEGSVRLFRSLVSQIIQKHQDLAVYVHDAYVQSHPLPSRKALMELLPKLLQGVGSSRFVLDGIDEWDLSEQNTILKDLVDLLSTDGSSYICKILIASRNTLDLSRNLRKKKNATVSISLDDSEERLSVACSVKDFVDSRLSDLPEHFDELDPSGEMLAQIRSALLEKSNGMFLWVRLVLDSLKFVYTLEELSKVVEELPSDLEALYDRILRRLCNSPGPRNLERVSRILSWICFSQRPLHKLELLQGIAIPPDVTAPDGQSAPLAQILDHCRPLIEEHSDSTITFVHFSIKEFFLKSNTSEIVDPTQTHLDISFACTTTLIRGLSLLSPIQLQGGNLKEVANGTYRFLPYALDNWIEHCLLYAASGGALEKEHFFSCRLVQLREKHDIFLREHEGQSESASAAEASPSGPLDERLELAAHLSIYDLMKGVLYLRWLSIQNPCEDGEGKFELDLLSSAICLCALGPKLIRKPMTLAAEEYAAQNDPTLFSKLAISFDKAVMALLSESEVPGLSKATLEAFQRSYATSAFRCRFPYCSKLSVGFASHQLRTEHEAGHFHRIYCRVTSCQWSETGFKSKSALDAHTRKYHGDKSTLSIPLRVQRSLEDGEGDKQQSARKYPVSSS